MNHNLFQCDVPNEDWFKLGPINFSTPKNRRTFFNWRHIIRNCDWTVGRNNLYAFLRIKGLLDRHNRPNLTGRWGKYFAYRTPKATITEVEGFIPSPALYIAGEGIYEIQRELAKTREAGGAI